MRHVRAQLDGWPVRIASVALAGVMAACGGGGDKPAPEATGGAPPPTDQPAPPAADTQVAPAGETGAGDGAGAGGGGGGDKASIALGDSIFHGQAAGGTCFACHGQDGKGTAAGPNLADGEWVHSDGSLEGIVKTVQTGVPQPKSAPAPMPPMGGATLTPDQVKAVATYVRSLSSKG
jgi:mono/diheme cytochrome c family protein